MRTYLLSAFILLFSIEAKAIPQCDDVDLPTLLKKIEDIVSDAPLGQEAELYNERITGKDRLCSRKLQIEHNQKTDMDKVETDIAETMDLISGSA